jgi:hypothetical protein
MLRLSLFAALTILPSCDIYFDDGFDDCNAPSPDVEGDRSQMMTPTGDNREYFVSEPVTCTTGLTAIALSTRGQNIVDVEAARTILEGAAQSANATTPTISTCSFAAGRM